MQASVLSHMNLKLEFSYIQAKGFPEPSDLCEPDGVVRQR